MRHVESGGGGSRGYTGIYRCKKGFSKQNSCNTSIKTKNWKIELPEPKYLLYSEGHHHSSEETLYKIGKSLCPYTYDTLSVSRLYKEPKKSTKQTNKQKT